MLAPVRFSMHARTGALEEDALEDAPLTELKQSKGPFRRGGDDGRPTSRPATVEVGVAQSLSARSKKKDE